MAKTKRKPRQKAETAPRTSTWNDSAGHRRPTPERMRHGTWRTVDTEIAGHSAAYDATAHPLDRLRAAGIIDADQLSAGLSAAELFARHRPTSEGRSCLDFSPVGADGEETEEDRASYRRYTELWQALGPFRAAMIRHVACDCNDPTAAQRKVLLDALTVCVGFFTRRR